MLVCVHALTGKQYQRTPKFLTSTVLLSFGSLMKPATFNSSLIQHTHIDSVHILCLPVLLLHSLALFTSWVYKS